MVNTCELQQVITYLQCSIASEYTSACKVNCLLLFCILEKVLLDLPDCRILSPDLYGDAWAAMTKEEVKQEVCHMKGFLCRCGTSFRPLGEVISDHFYILVSLLAWCTPIAQRDQYQFGRSNFLFVSGTDHSVGPDKATTSTKSIVKIINAFVQCSIL